MLSNKITSKFTTVTLGNPITTPVLIPVKHAATPTCINNPFMINGECHKVTAMSFGNPHGAVFVSDVDDIDVETLGSALGTHALFPEGADIVFVQVLDKENIKARLWQRGQGETAFTCEAACAAGTAAMMCQKIFFSEANISMGGNLFRMNWDRSGDGVSLTGPENLLRGSMTDPAYSRASGENKARHSLQSVPFVV